MFPHYRPFKKWLPEYALVIMEMIQNINERARVKHSNSISVIILEYSFSDSSSSFSIVLDKVNTCKNGFMLGSQSLQERSLLHDVL